VSRLSIGLSLALAASIALNASYLMQHVASSGAPSIDIRRPLRTLGSLLSSRLWLSGGVLGLAGWAMSIIAMTKAPLSLVQAFLVGGLAVFAPIAVRLLGHRLSAAETAGIALMILALFALILGRGRVGVHSHYHPWVLATYLLLASSAGAALLAVKRRGAQALGLAGGVLYGAADVAIKALTGLAARHGVIAAALSPWLIAAAGASVGAFFCFQRGLQSGNAIPVIALMTAATNVVSILGGLIVFADPLGPSPTLVVIHALAFAAIVAAAWLLAPAQAVSVSGPRDSLKHPIRPIAAR